MKIKSSFFCVARFMYVLRTLNFLIKLRARYDPHILLISPLAQSVRNNGLIESCETAAHILNSVMSHVS